MWSFEAKNLIERLFSWSLMSTCAAADFSFFLVKTKSQGVVHAGGRASIVKGIYKLSMLILDSRPEEAPRVFGTYRLFSIMYSHCLIRPCTCQRCRPFLLCKFSTSNSPSFRQKTHISRWNFSADNHSQVGWHRDTVEVCCVCLDLPWMGRISNPAMPSWEWIRPRVPQRSVRSGGRIPKIHSISRWHQTQNTVVDWTKKGKVMKGLGHLAAKFQKWNDCAWFLKTKLRSLNTFWVTKASLAAGLPKASTR